MAIRMARFEDSQAIADIYQPYVAASAISFELVPPPGSEIEKRMSAASDRYPWLVCEQAGVVVGFSYASHHRVREAYRWSVDVSVYVSNSAQRHGIGRNLYTALFAILERQRYISAFAGITHSNASSIAMHLAFGFDLVGVYRDAGYKLGQWHDVAWYQRKIQECSSGPPLEPLPLSLTPLDASMRA
jgi:L-amino acid N-acyltransferase YncA